MTVTAAFQNNIPNAWADAFIDGEKALTPVATLTGAATRVTYYLSRWFNFLGGVYTIKLVASDAVTMYVGPRGDTLRSILGQVVGDGVSIQQIYIPTGLNRVNLELRKLTGGNPNTFVAFSIYQGGALVYSSAAQYWKVDQSPLLDAVLLGKGDQRRLLPVFSVLPNWESGITETFAFSTDSMDSETATRQLRSLFQGPKRTFEANFLRSTNRRSRLDNFIVGTGQDRLMVPLFHEQFIVPIEMSPSTTKINFPSKSLHKREFRIGDLLFVNNKAPEAFDVLEILDLDFETDVLTLKSSPSRIWPSGTRIFPMRIARIMDQATFENQTDRIATSTIRFTIDEFEDHVEPSWGYCAPLFRFPINWNESLPLRSSRNTYIVENNVATPIVYDFGEKAEIGTTVQVTLKGRDAVYSLRSFIAMARGAAQRFYMPTFVSNLEPFGDIPAGTTFDARPTGFTEYFKRPQDGRVLIGISFTNGSPTLYRTLIGTEAIKSSNGVDIAAERFTVDADLPPIQERFIRRIEFIQPVRFNQDLFSFVHQIADSSVVQASLTTRSAELDGMPPIECFVTSRPYPVEDIVVMDAAARLAAGRTFSPLTVEGMSVANSLTAGSLKVTFHGYQNPPEGIQTSIPSLTGQFLITVYGSYAIRAEGIQIDPPRLSTGSMIRTVLPPYIMKVEAVQSGAPSLTTGSLS